MASVHLQAWVEGEGDGPNMTIDLIMTRPEIYLHDDDSARTFLYEAVCDVADQIRRNLLLEVLDEG